MCHDVDGCWCLSRNLVLELLAGGGGAYRGVAHRAGEKLFNECIDLGATQSATLADAETAAGWLE